jgi:hypothetical protein
MAHRQLDVIATGPDWYTIPPNVPGRLNAEDFIFFQWPESLEPIRHRYTVVLETKSVSSGSPFRSIAPVIENVQLPLVQFGWYPAILVLPDSEDLPAFRSTLIRGSTYTIPKVGPHHHPDHHGFFQMERHGMFRGPGV